jgi:hypothetical protein
MRETEFCGRTLVSCSSPFCVFCACTMFCVFSACTMFSPTPVFFFSSFENEVLDFFYERPCRGACSIINDLPFLYIRCCNLFSAFLVVLFVNVPVFFPIFVARVESSRWSWTPPPLPHPALPRSTDKSCCKTLLYHPDLHEKCHVTSCHRREDRFVPWVDLLIHQPTE